MFSYIYVHGISHDAHWVETSPLNHRFLQNGLYSFEPLILDGEDGPPRTPFEAIQRWLSAQSWPRQIRAESPEPTVPLTAPVDNRSQEPTGENPTGAAQRTLDPAVFHDARQTEPRPGSSDGPGADTVTDAGATMATTTLSGMGSHAALADQLRAELDGLGVEIGDRLVDGRGAVLCQAIYSLGPGPDDSADGDPKLLALTIYDPGVWDRHITALSPLYDLLSNAFPRPRVHGVQDVDVSLGVTRLIGDTEHLLHLNRDAASVYLFASQAA